jgi:hypothetical protein
VNQDILSIHSRGQLAKPELIVLYDFLHPEVKLLDQEIEKKFRITHIHPALSDFPDSEIPILQAQKELKNYIDGLFRKPILVSLGYSSLISIEYTLQRKPNLEKIILISPAGYLTNMKLRLIHSFFLLRWQKRGYRFFLKSSFFKRNLRVSGFPAIHIETHILLQDQTHHSGLIYREEVGSEKYYKFDSSHFEMDINENRVRVVLKKILEGESD